MKMKAFISQLNQMSEPAFALFRAGLFLSCAMLLFAVLWKNISTASAITDFHAYRIAWELFTNASLVLLLSGLGAAIIEGGRRK